MFGLVAVVILGVVTACSDSSFPSITSAGSGQPPEPAPSPREVDGPSVPKGKLIASGDGWRLGLNDGEVGGANWRILCFTLVGPNLHNVSCSYVNPEYVGLAKVDSLQSKGSVFYGTVSTPVSRIQVRFEDGSIAEADIFAPPGTVEIKDNLFVLELQGPEGGAVATLLDERGRRLATADFRLPPPKGEILFAFDRV